MLNVTYLMRYECSMATDKKVFVSHIFSYKYIIVNVFFARGFFIGVYIDYIYLWIIIFTVWITSCLQLQCSIVH